MHKNTHPKPSLSLTWIAFASFAFTSIAQASPKESQTYTNPFVSYMGKQASMSCGASLAQAERARAETVIFESVDANQLGGPGLAISGHFFRKTNQAQARYQNHYGGDVGRKVYFIQNEFKNNIFTQIRVEKEGSIFLNKTYEEIKRVNFKDPRKLIFDWLLKDFDSGETQKETCVIKLQS
jgi:hypothetical protein